MDKHEFKRKIEDIFMDFNKDKDYDFILVALDQSPEAKGAIIVGFGCGRCMAEGIAGNLDKFNHTGKDHKRMN